MFWESLTENQIVSSSCKSELNIWTYRITMMTWNAQWSEGKHIAE